jgi:hypothetical protein
MRCRSELTRHSHRWGRGLHALSVVLMAALATFATPGRGADPDAVTARHAQAGAVVAVPAPGMGDERRFMHGIAWASAGGDRSWVFFSSSGLPPRGANPDGSWPHDVYVGEWSPTHRHLENVHIFISRPEAQEPVSVAQNTDGNIFVSFEDGWNAPRTISQRYGVYREDLASIKPYPNDVESGGHSGHVAAIGEHFVAFYSEDWVDGGGVDNLGTGNGVYVKVYDSRGALLRHLDVAPHVREWWPVIAGSPTHALLVWQKYIPGTTIAQLAYAVLDPATGQLAKPAEPDGLPRVEYYTYTAAWVPAVNRFVLEATADNGRSSVLLIDEEGRITARMDCLPASVREASIAVNGSVAFVPTRDGRLMALTLSADAIRLRGFGRAPFAWGNTGAIGIPYGASSVHFVSLSPTGLREADFSERDEVAPSDADRCDRQTAQK